MRRRTLGEARLRTPFHLSNAAVNIVRSSSTLASGPDFAEESAEAVGVGLTELELSAVVDGLAEEPLSDADAEAVGVAEEPLSDADAEAVGVVSAAATDALVDEAEPAAEDDALAAAVDSEPAADEDALAAAEDEAGPALFGFGPSVPEPPVRNILIPFSHSKESVVPLGVTCTGESGEKAPAAQMVNP